MKHAPVLLVWLATLPACAQFGLDQIDPSKIGEGLFKAGKSAQGIGLQEELAIGGSVAVEIVAAYGGIWKDGNATRRINFVGKTLGAMSERPELTYYFGILNSEDINAFATPGGYVFITHGAYLACGDDDQLAGVLAHEIAHITKRHALRIISRSGVVSGLTSAAVGGAGYGEFDAGIDKCSQSLLKFGYDAGTEFDADEAGAWLAYSSGYGKDGLKQFLEGLAAKSQGHATFSTHPKTPDRIKRLSK
jgi:predicted Zn-dependent protease